ncbi:MAG: hypothetical protein L6Q84_09085 [Polyangiaceae bacterium]|nr:hypothetical protein [Polyangiaceae bacterium]
MRPIPRWQTASLAHNPFGELFAFDRAALAVPCAEVAALLPRLDGERSVLELVGPPGVGKSTHLAWLAGRLAAPLVRIPARGASPALPDSQTVLIDELQRASWAERQAIARSCVRTLVVAAHCSHAVQLASAGRRVLRATIRGLTQDGLRSYVARRVAWAGAAPGGFDVPSALLDGLHTRHRSDVRAIEQALYDWCEESA